MSDQDWPAICRYIAERLEPNPRFDRHVSLEYTTGLLWDAGSKDLEPRWFDYDWSACGTLIEAMRSAGFGIEIHNALLDEPPFADVAKFMEIGVEDSGGKRYRHYGDTIPEAVTLAAYRALGGNDALA